MIFAPGSAEAGRKEQEALSAYARARAADSFGSAEAAARGYAAALAVSPGNELLAFRTFSQAVAAGDRDLALRAARLLDGGALTGPDVRLLLLSDALKKRDWKRASAQIDSIKQDQVFGFMAPTLRAWVALSSGKGDPFALLAEAQANPLGASYAAEHRPLLLLAAGHHDMGAEELVKLTEDGGLRAQRLRIAAAALLAEEGEKGTALSLLAGPAPSAMAARALIQSGKPIPGAIDSASAGIAELLVRIAGDLHRQDVTDLALRFARIATFMAPESSETWIVTADLLSTAGQHEAGLAALENIGKGDPFLSSAVDARIKLLVAAEQNEQALRLADAAANAAGADVSDWIRLGELHAALERPSEAADAYARAIALAANDEDQPLWALHLLRGGTLEEAGRWPEAKAELQKAYELAPQQPLVLNYLGYAQLERRENIEEAMRLIAEASKLQPDSAEITDSLGWAHFLQGEMAEAIPLLEQAARGLPADPEINEHLGDAYYKAGRHYEARYAWRAALAYAEDEAAERLRAKIDAGLTPELASP